MADLPNGRTIPLTFTDHRRDILGYTYVYPVVSRRAGGVSIGVNLNTNNACNWRCIYCQVPDLIRGAAPPIDLDRLTDELEEMLHEVIDGDFMHASVSEDLRRLNDIALSGNGEPTASPQFAQAVETLIAARAKRPQLAHVKLVLITNGSQMHKGEVQAAIARMSESNGEVWFKFDRAPSDGYCAVNQISMTAEQVLRRLEAACARCATWVQTCMFEVDGAPPDAQTIDAYLGILAKSLEATAKPEGVLLYGLARPSSQPEAATLSRASDAWMRILAARIQEIGLAVKLSV